MLEKFKSHCQQQAAQIPQERLSLLASLAENMVEMQENGNLHLLWIDTHNSRRSIFCQVWAKCWAMHYGLRGFKMYSGGTKVEAIHTNTLDALNNAGLFVNRLDARENAHYQLYYQEGEAPVAVFSKLLEDAPNPKDHFLGIYTSATAKERVPTISGARLTFSLLYPDPKSADGSLEEEGVYAELNEQVAVEMGVLFGMVAGKIGV
ncbi:hypothetical protein [Persicobacter diffluens]|uniref:Arsenate reductase n=1 Tax=Persicobacter diffluens TaxID=981 RepID=A0AAN4W071_9BACT|nr:arsenate reductase [Persicobacter diffluens]